MIAAAALYCRVSTDNQTCARQKRDLSAFATNAGYKIVGSGRKQEGPRVGAGPQGRRDPRHRTDPLGAARSYRGRDSHCWMPPAQIPAGVIHALYVLQHIMGQCCNFAGVV